MGLKFEPVLTKKGDHNGTLHIDIKSAHSLPNMDKHGFTDGFVKISLLPEKKKKEKTRVISNNLDPIWNEKFKFSNVTSDELSVKRALELTVWDKDMFSIKFIGYVRLGPVANKQWEEGQEWMDSSREEVEHWEEMLARPGVWVERCHPLRSSKRHGPPLRKTGSLDRNLDINYGAEMVDVESKSATLDRKVTSNFSKFDDYSAYKEAGSSEGQKSDEYFHHRVNFSSK